MPLAPLPGGIPRRPGDAEGSRSQPSLLPLGTASESFGQGRTGPAASGEWVATRRRLPRAALRGPWGGSGAAEGEAIRRQAGRGTPPRIPGAAQTTRRYWPRDQRHQQQAAPLLQQSSGARGPAPRETRGSAGRGAARRGEARRGGVVTGRGRGLQCAATARSGTPRATFNLRRVAPAGAAGVVDFPTFLPILQDSSLSISDSYSSWYCFANYRYIIRL